MKALLLIVACIILIRILKRSIRTGSNANRGKVVTTKTVKIKAMDPLQVEKQQLARMQLENKYNNEILKREKQYMQAAKIRKQHETEKFKRYQARQDKINYEIEKQDLLRNNYVLSSEKGSEKFNKRILNLDKKIEKAAFESIEF